MRIRLQYGTRQNVEEYRAEADIADPLLSAEETLIRSLEIQKFNQKLRKIFLVELFFSTGLKFLPGIS